MEVRANPFLNRRVAFAGKLGGMTLREAASLVRRLGGTPVSRDDPKVDLVVLGAGELLDDPPSSGSLAGTTLTETELWRQLGLLDDCPVSRKLYTPAMLAELLGVPIATIRRWHRRKLILPRQTVLRLPYFAFEEIAVARRLIELADSGASLEQIESQVQNLNERWPGLQPSVDGKRLVVRQGDALLEADGQQRFDFRDEASSDSVETIQLRGVPAAATAPQLIAQAEEQEEAGDDAGAVDLYRAALVAGGPNAQICFQLAECLYRLGDLTAARERYCMAIELEDAFLEARANLGCVLAELGQADLAVAAFEGALALHPDYADAHYHLARLLAAAGREEEAQLHRERFQELAPASPWSDQPDGM